MAWGIYDTVADGWVGNEDGPARYDDEQLARACAQVAECSLLGTDLVKRLIAREIPERKNWKLIDTVPLKMSPVKALQQIEGVVDDG